MIKPINNKRVKQRGIPKRSRGFSLVEVLVAILLAGLFFVLVLQGTFVGSSFRAAAADAVQGHNWIQEDLERIRFQAGQYNWASLAENVAIGSSSITVDTAEDFAIDDLIMFLDGLNNPSAEPVFRVVSKSGNQLGISPATEVAHSVGDKVIKVADRITSLNGSFNVGEHLINVTDAVNLAPNDQIRIDPAMTLNQSTLYSIYNVNSTQLTLSPALSANAVTGASIARSRCNAISLDKGYAAGLRAKVGGNLTETKTAKNNRTFTLERAATVIDDPPFNRLQLAYTVIPTTGNPAPVASVTTEVVPSAVSYCPQP